jgi:hypothetical protein
MSQSTNNDNINQPSKQNTAVDNFLTLYSVCPESIRPQFLKASMLLSRERPQIFSRVFSSTNLNTILTESQDIIQWLQGEVKRLEGQN